MYFSLGFDLDVDRKPVHHVREQEERDVRRDVRKVKLSEFKCFSFSKRGSLSLNKTMMKFVKM